MSFEFSHLPVSRSYHRPVRGFVGRRLDLILEKESSNINLRNRLSLSEAARALKISETKLLQLGVSINGIDLAILRKELAREIPGEFKAREKAGLTLERAMELVLWRAGDERIVLETFSAVEALKREDVAMEDKPALLAAYIDQEELGGALHEARHVIAIMRQAFNNKTEEEREHFILEVARSHRRQHDFLAWAAKLLKPEISFWGRFVAEGGALFYPENKYRQKALIAHLAKSMCENKLEAMGQFIFAAAQIFPEGQRRGIIDEILKTTYPHRTDLQTKLFVWVSRVSAGKRS